MAFDYEVAFCPGGTMLAAVFIRASQEGTDLPVAYVLDKSSCDVLYELTLGSFGRNVTDTPGILAWSPNGEMFAMSGYIIHVHNQEVVQIVEPNRIKDLQDLSFDSTAAFLGLTCCEMRATSCTREPSSARIFDTQSGSVLVDIGHARFVTFYRANMWALTVSAQTDPPHGAAVWDILQNSTSSLSHPGHIRS